MKKIALISAVIVIVIGAGFLVWQQFIRQAPQPIISPTPSPSPSPMVILPSDNEFPAAGACSESGGGDLVQVSVNIDIPSPRCQKVIASDRLSIKNTTEEELSMWFGDNKEYSFRVPANGEYEFPYQINEFLAPGVHVLHSTPYFGPEIWFVVEKTPYLFFFRDFSESDIYTGIPAQVDFATYPAAKTFKTKITEGAKLGPNFSGHYTVIEWGCGTSCQMHAIVDAKTGAIVEYGLGSSLGLQYKLTRRLLVANPPSYIDELSELPAGVVVAYYAMQDGHLTLLARQKPGEASALTDQNGGGIMPYDSGVTGTVLLGPTCPVEKIPPDPQCADKPYKTIVQAVRVGSPQSAPFATANTDEQGRYTLKLPPGEYALQPVGGNPLPRCETKSVTVEPGMIKEVDLSCDTGIR